MDETFTGACENGKEGTITYQCTSGEWKTIEDNCVVKVIKDLQRKVEVIY